MEFRFGSYPRQTLRNLGIQVLDDALELRIRRVPLEQLVQVPDALDVIGYLDRPLGRGFITQILPVRMLQDARVRVPGSHEIPPSLPHKVLLEIDVDLNLGLDKGYLFIEHSGGLLARSR